jgi:hypothetical protein
MSRGEEYILVLKLRRATKRSLASFTLVKMVEKKLNLKKGRWKVACLSILDDMMFGFTLSS